ncbi:BAN [Symbiodinium microadriaticum]|nr:BAN [Symbiodinium microadriaticum]
MELRQNLHYVATELVKQLLENGFHVKGTVRSVKSKDKYAHLEKLDAALPGTLKQLEADLLKTNSFDACAKNSKYVFHTAAENSLKDMIEPARNGTQNVLKPAIKAKSPHVVVTSSFAASSSFLPEDKPDPGNLYSEEDWNGFIDESAWELGKSHGIDVVVIQPVLVMGPVHAPRVEGVSVGTMKTLVEGGPLPAAFPWCDNRDVARAHIQAAVNPAASGRYIVAQPNTIPHSVYSVLSKGLPQFVFANPEKEEAQNAMIDTKIKGLGACTRWKTRCLTWQGH